MKFTTVSTCKKYTQVMEFQPRQVIRGTKITKNESSLIAGLAEIISQEKNEVVKIKLLEKLNRRELIDLILFFGIGNAKLISYKII